VYRITRSGETTFMRLLTENVTGPSLADTEKFDLRMTFFQYLDPETRLKLLEMRRAYLEDQVAKFKAYRSTNEDEDRYRTGLLRHKVDLARSDIRWITRLMAHEREAISKRDDTSGVRQMEVKTTKGQVSAI
jgi:hypothetical protein